MKHLRTKTKGRCAILLWTLFSGLCLLSGTGFAQTGVKQITGTILSKTSSDPIAGAVVKVKGTKNTVTTGPDGAFTILSKAGEVLEISYVGYLTQSVAVGNESSIRVKLQEDYSKLEDVVVVGYGKMKKIDLSSSQVTVTAADIAKTVNTTFDQALQGRAANVYVSSGSGQPGAAPSVVIRGLSSLSGSTQPLYVIDGVQIKPENPSDNPYAHPTGFANALSGINPDDIETMNVLQGPSATSIYGSAGGNGVIMITTKRGRAGDTKITASTLWTVQDKPKYIPVMNLPEYAVFRNEVAKAGGAAFDSTFSDPSVLGPGTNWQAALFRRTVLQKHSLSLSGGTDKTTFFFSGEYFNQDGIAPGSGFSRASVRLNLDNQTRSWLKIGTSLSANQTKEKVNITNGGIIQLAIQQNPGIPVKNPDGSYGGPTVTQFAYTNPVGLANIYNDYNKGTGLIGGVYGDITLMKGLVLHNEANATIQYNNNYQFHPSYAFGGYINNTSFSSRQGANNYWWSFNTRLQYNNKFGLHSIDAMIAHEAQAYGYESVSGSRQSFVTNNIQELPNGDLATANNFSSKGDGSKESYFGRFNYIYNDRYILQGTVRYDGASSFGPNRRWGAFPAASAAWRISQEEFMKNLPLINDLKLRLEYGWTGNSNGSGYYARLSPIPTGSGTGFISSNFPNPDLQWEVDKTWNIGFDLHMFNNRIEVIADAYLKNMDKLLTVIPTPYYLGSDIGYSPGFISPPSTNIAAMKNKGFGITINTVNVVTKKLTWKTSLNFSMDRNRITYLPNPINPSYAGTQVSFLSKQGETASLITGYTYDGLFQDYNDIKNHAIQTSNGAISPTQGTWVGDVKFRDLDGNGVIDQNDRSVIGNPWPKFTFGFNNSVSYKGFDLNVFMTGSVGNKILNYVRFQNETPNGSGPYSNYYKDVAGFARPSSSNIGDSLKVTLLNPGTSIQRISPSDPNGNGRISQKFLEDGSYVRVKNISLAYSLPAKLISKYALKGLRLAVNVQNPFTITKYKGYDPEVGMVNYGGTIMVGVDTGRYPSVRLYSVNLTADF